MQFPVLEGPCYQIPPLEKPEDFQVVNLEIVLPEPSAPSHVPPKEEIPPSAARELSSFMDGPRTSFLQRQ